MTKIGNMNKELELAKLFVEKTNRNIFLTGKAGTGKTTFLRELQKNLPKRMVVVAPTGVAAINAKGVTIHSFFQLPFSPIIPNSLHNNTNIQRKFNKKKIDIIRSLDLVIIDEISMVRADVLDGIDEVLRRYKNKNKPFGGTQMLFIGDLQQLSPVVKQDEWELLSSYYDNAFFFSSLAYKSSNVIPIELKHIYRQQNKDFINILNEIRHNKLSEESAEKLNKQYKPNFNPEDDEGYIILTTHNNKANAINNKKINALKTETHSYTADVNGNFPENSYPLPECLELKVGSQVMFVKNDLSPEKLYFNGKIGTIVELNEDIVSVQCGDEVIDVGAVTWENIKYTLDDETQEIKENIEGKFSQVPLRLAWAITIHKSQGLTFDKAIIDAEASFAHGQTYVALSRCKTLEGIVLQTPINTSSIVNDNRVNSFNEQMETLQPNEKDLQESQKAFQLDLIAELFDFNALIYPVNRIIGLYYKNASSLQGNIIEPMQSIKNNALTPLIQVSEGFNQQLKIMSANAESIETDSAIQERFSKAIAYFSKEFTEKVEDVYKTFAFSTDNKALNKDIERQVKQFEELLQVKLNLFSNITTPFSTEEFLKIRAKALLDKPKKQVKKRAEVTSTQHQELFEELRQYRLMVAQEEDVSAYVVFTQKTLFELCELLPENKKQLKQIHGMGKVRIDKYGDEILDIINTYAKTHGLQSQVELIEVEKETQNTKQVTLNLFNEGLNITEIAEKRGLVVGTIESHLAHFILNNELPLSAMISEEKAEKGFNIIKNTKFEGLNELKHIVGDEFSYTELRLLMGLLNNEE